MTKRIFYTQSYVSYLHNLLEKGNIKFLSYEDFLISDSPAIALEANCLNEKVKSPQTKNEKTFLDRIMRQVKKDSKTGCWVWQGAKSNNYGKFGRGKIFFRGRHNFVHRLMFAHFKGGLKKGLVIRHICNNGLCCNPDHLLTGTVKENIQDLIDFSGLYNSYSIKVKFKNKSKLEVFKSKEELARTLKITTATLRSHFVKNSPNHVWPKYNIESIELEKKND